MGMTQATTAVANTNPAGVGAAIGTYLWWRRRSFVAPGTQAQNPLGLEPT
jgi:hypothetical protein